MLAAPGHHGKACNKHGKHGGKKAPFCKKRNGGGGGGGDGGDDDDNGGDDND